MVLWDTAFDPWIMKGKAENRKLNSINRLTSAEQVNELLSLIFVLQHGISFFLFFFLIMLQFLISIF